MPRIDITAVSELKGTGYPAEFNTPCAERVRQRLGDAGGLTDFGINLMRLPPGNWSSQRHWHSHEDEFVYVLEGELTLIENDGETVLRAGDCAAFPKGTGNGHHMINRTDALAVYRDGVPDLLSLLANWGACPLPCPPSCPEDINGDCAVGVPDLLAMLGAWGPCP